MYTKICSKCGKEKAGTEYYKAHWLKDGLRPECKDCHKQYRKNRKLEYTIHNMAKGILDRTGRRKDYHKNKAYENIECRIGETSKEIYDYLTKYHKEKIKELLDKKIVPSIDRIDSTKHYEHGNLRIIPLEQNIKQAGKITQQRHGKKVLVEYPNGYLKMFPSIKNCSDELRIKRDTIYRNIDTNRKTTHGYRFHSLK